MVSSRNTVKVGALTKLQYGDWIHVTPKKPLYGSFLSRGRIRYHDVGSSSNVPSNDLGKGPAKADPTPEAVLANLRTPLDADLGENMTDDNIVEDLLDIAYVETEPGQCHSVMTVSTHAAHDLLDTSYVGSEEGPNHVTRSALDSATHIRTPVVSAQSASEDRIAEAS
ncbi:hypothetical protein V6N13_142394 [Hibiscus sabdariffa]